MTTTTLADIEREALIKAAKYLGNEAAFPVAGTAMSNGEFAYGEAGLTRRQEFAKCFTAALLKSGDNPGNTDFPFLAKVAVRMADELLLALAKP